MSNSIERQAVIDGLRELADWLEAHPDVPVNNWQGISYSASAVAPSDADARTEVDRIAEATGIAPTGTDYYEVIAYFGPVTYNACAISGWRLAAAHAESTCRGSVQPDEDAGAVAS